MDKVIMFVMYMTILQIAFNGMLAILILGAILRKGNK